MTGDGHLRAARRSPPRPVPHRRVRQDERTGPHVDPRGDGAAKHLGLQGGHRHDLQARCSSSQRPTPRRPLRFESALLGERVAHRPDPQRFDVLCVLEDKVDPVADNAAALLSARTAVRGRSVAATARAMTMQRRRRRSSSGRRRRCVCQRAVTTAAARAARGLRAGRRRSSQPEDDDDELSSSHRSSSRSTSHAREHCSPQLARIDQAKVARSTRSCAASRRAAAACLSRCATSKPMLWPRRVRACTCASTCATTTSTSRSARCSSPSSRRKSSRRVARRARFCALPQRGRRLRRAPAPRAAGARPRRTALRGRAALRPARRSRELDDEPLEAHMDDLEARARDLACTRSAFTVRARAHLEVDHKRRMIVKAL